jgi:hypothetical protein
MGITLHLRSIQLIACFDYFNSIATVAAPGLLPAPRSA